MKEFKTIAEQVSILESRGMTVGPNASIVLLREKYYSIVNGYKDPFLDKDAMQERPDDVYVDGTEFDWLYSLLRFDRELRHITFSYLIRAEAALKTATVYTFCENHQGCSDYLERSSFCTAKDMLVAKKFKGNKAVLYSNNLNYLMNVLNKKLVVGPSTRPFIAQYLNTHGEVPLWVLANDLTFGNMAHFFQLMKRGDQNAVCKHLYVTTMCSVGNKRITPHDVLRAYDVLVYFRNLCAHDERLYCARKDNDTFSTMVDLMAVALPKAVVEDFRKGLEALLSKYDESLHVITAANLRGAWVGPRRLIEGGFG